MKYKIKFELDYSNMSAQEIRDSKIDEVLLNKNELMEMEIDPQFKLPLPKIGETVDIKGKQYGVINSKTRIDDVSYTVVYLVESHEGRKSKKPDPITLKHLIGQYKNI